MSFSHRERFLRLFNGEPVDRVPFLDIMGFWPSSLARWKTEGLDQDATIETVRKIIGVDGHRGYKLPIKGYIWPEFDREVWRRRARTDLEVPAGNHGDIVHLRRPRK